MQDKDRQRK